MRMLFALLAGAGMTLGLGGLDGGSARAGSLEIAPTTIDLPAGNGKAVFYVTNRGSEPVVVQIEGFDWHQTDTADQLERSETLALSPPMTRLLPEQRQTIRLSIKRSGLAKEERSFRLIVSELPDPQASPETGVTMLLQLSVPIFAAGSDPHPAQLVWEAGPGAGGLWLTVRNTGMRRAKLMNLQLTLPDGTPIPIAPNTISYILAGASHRWTNAAAGVKAGDLLRLTGRNENDRTMIDTSVIVGP